MMLVKQADPGIKTWLPAALWARMHPDGIREIVDYVFHAIKSVSSHIGHGGRATVNLNALPSRKPARAARKTARDATRR